MQQWMRRFAVLWLCALGAIAHAQEAGTPAPSATAIAPPSTVAPSTVAPSAVAPAPSVVASYDVAAWQALAQRAEAAISAARASDLTLAQLRADLVTWRSTFLALQSANRERIITIERQLAALGAAPADGAAELPEIAQSRADLAARLAQLRAPVLLAAQAHAHADRLIAELDGVLRQRWQDRLTTRGTSPLLPSAWGEAVAGLQDGLRTLANETAAEWANPIRSEAFIKNLPGVLALVVLGLVLIMRGNKASAWAVQKLSGQSMRLRGVLMFLAALGGLALPFFGVTLLAQGLQLSGMFGFRGARIVAAVPDMAVHVIVAYWLSQQLLSAGQARTNPLDMGADQLRRMRRWLMGLAWVLSFGVLVEVVSGSVDISDAGRAAIVFPLWAAGAWVMVQLGRALARVANDATTEASAPERPRPYRFGLAALLGQGLALLGYGALVLGAFGYTQAFELLLYSGTGTLFLLGGVVLVQGFVFDLYSAVTRHGDSASEALVPVLVGFLLSFAALPFLAMIWGARASDLTELWATFREGFRLGDAQISPTNFLTFVAVFTVGYMATRLVQGALRSTVLPKTRLDAGGRNAIVAGVGYLGVFLAALVAITTAGIDLSGLAIVAGALSVGIGFGLQNIVSNFVSGIILLIERPIAEGDWIEVGGQMGYVRDISVRSTRIETFDRSDVIVPNADLVSGAVTNYTRGNTIGRLILPVGVGYGSDTRQVEQILRSVAEAHPLVQQPPSILFMGFGADSLDFEIRAILRDVNSALSVRSDMNHEIAQRFADAGIEIPFAQRDIWIRNPEALAKPQLLRGTDEDDQSDATEAPPEPAKD